MSIEERIFTASVITGILELLLAIFMSLTGLHEWYYNKFHMFGVLGIGMLIYGFVHFYLWDFQVNNERRID